MRLLNGFRIAMVCCLLIYTMTAVFAQDDDDNEGDTPMTGARAIFATTYQQPTGNRVVEGSGTFPAVEAQVVNVEGVINWVVGYIMPRDASDDVDAPAVFSSGDLRFTYTTDLDQSGDVDFLPDTGAMIGGVGALDRPEIPWKMSGSEQFDNIALDDLSPFSHPVIAPERMAFVTVDGDVVLCLPTGELRGRQAINAIPDARLVMNSAGTRIALYADGTNQRYVHGVLGDDVEGAALYVLDLYDLRESGRIELQGDEVFEGLSPIWADVDGDGNDELITTVSNGEQGAQIRVYRPNGDLLATGDAIGRGGRWRHQLAWGAFGINREMNLVDVLTPHIGGVVEFYEYDGADRLNIVARQPGFTSHVINSRNLDMAVAGDFNGDGVLELAIPDQSRSFIAGLQRGEGDTVREVWRLELDGAQVSSNLAAVTLPDGRLALAVGASDGTLRVWLPGVAE